MSSVLENKGFPDAFSQLGFFNSVTDEVRNCLKKFVCALYGYKNENVNNVRVKMFQMKRINDVALLPPYKDNLKLHISRVNYVANMYDKTENAIRLHMSWWSNISRMETRRYSSIVRWLFPWKYHWCFGNLWRERWWLC